MATDSMTILVVSDIHANLAALDAVLAAAGPVDAVWNLGDTVGYGPFPGDCIDRIVGLRPEVMLLGNHDAAATALLSLDEFNSIARAATLWTAEQLTSEQRVFLAGLPSSVSIRDCLCVHGSPRHPLWEYVYSARIANAGFKAFDESVCFLGHTHLQLFITEAMASNGIAPALPQDGDTLDLAGERFIVNPGSVGQPRDGNPKAAFALYEPIEQRVVFRRVRYDIERTQAAMRSAGLPSPLIARLSSGV